MMKINRAALLLAFLLLTGCSLAQPEARTADADRFLGFYVVLEEKDSTWSSNPYLTEYGSITASTQYGTIRIPKRVLKAEETDGQYRFPGLEGYSLFLLSKTTPDGANYTDCISDLSPDSEGMQVHVSDEGTRNTVGGVLYIGPPLDTCMEDWELDGSNSHFLAYRVYESSDGTVYLDGSGNGFTGPSTYQETYSQTTTKNGESTTDTLMIKITVEAVPRLENLVVSQFDAANVLLSSDDVVLRDDLPEIHCLPETAWVLVEEQSAEGSVRTVYNAPAEGTEPVVHTIVLLDDTGLGHTADLSITEYKAPFPNSKV